MNHVAARRLLALLRGEDFDPPADEDGWRALVRLADRCGVIGSVAHGLPAAAGAPARVRDLLAEHARREGLHHGWHLLEAERLVAALAGEGIPVVLLKGLGLARNWWPHPLARGFRDLDLLVRPEDVDRSLSLLAGLGYRPEAGGSLLDVYRTHHFHLVLRGDGRPRVELHWALARPGDPYRLEAAAMLADPRPLAGREAIPVPGPAAQLLHAAVSEFRCGFTELRRLLDARYLLAAVSPEELSSLAARARERGLGPALGLLLLLSHRLLGSPPAPAEVLALLPRRTLAALEAIGIPGFPLHLGRADRQVVRHLVRWHLSAHPGATAMDYLFHPRFEREKARALRIPAGRRVRAFLLRATILAGTVAWQAWRSVRGPDRHLTSLASPSSGPRGAGTAGTPAPAP